jgi:hypothetical protein
MARTLTDDGLMQRFLVYRVGRTGVGEDREPDQEAVNRYGMMMAYLAHREPTGSAVRLSAEAQRYRREVEALANALSDTPMVPPALRGHAAKINGLFARLLLTMHTIDYYASHGYMLDENDFAIVSAETARRSRDLMVHFLIPSVVRVYAAYFGGECDPDGADARWIADHLLAHRKDRVSERDLYRANRDFDTPDRKRLRRAVETLIEGNWLLESMLSRTEWIVNPTARERFADQAEQARQHRDETKVKIERSAELVRQTYS